MGFFALDKKDVAIVAYQLTHSDHSGIIREIRF